MKSTNTLVSEFLYNLPPPGRELEGKGDLGNLVKNHTKIVMEHSSFQTAFCFCSGWNIYLVLFYLFCCEDHV